MELHHLLIRQLKRLGLQDDNCPENLAAWQKFLAMVNNAYHETDQELDLNERSMEVSSKELSGLNEKRIQNEEEILDLHEQLLGLVRNDDEEEISVLHQRLLNLARSAGMADVASSILHNVGNILSSTNTSINLLEEYISKSYYAQSFEAMKMIKDHEGNLGDYLTQDPKGKLIPEYLATIVDIIENGHEKLKTEIINLKGYLQHIKDIIAEQQALTGVKGYPETVNVLEIMDAALQISGLTPEKKIVVHKHYKTTPITILDKTKLLQILVNLINNAKDSLTLRKEFLNKRIDIEISSTSENQLMISVQDNGLGIDPENLSKVFYFGFTTKQSGHGFGLHNSALLAETMGGTLSVMSEGINCGATFVLTLPLSSASNRSQHQ